MWPDDDTDLPVEVYAAFGADPAGDPGDWTFTSLTDRLMDNPIPIRSGATAGGTVSASSATLHLLNDDGALTPLYAGSVYYPNVALGTPIWVPLRRAEDAFGRTVSNGWGSADSGQSWAAWNGSASDYSTNGTAGRHSHGGTINILRKTLLDVNLLDAQQTVDASTSALTTGAALVTGMLFRYDLSAHDYYWARTEFNPGGTTVMLKITRMRGGVLTDLAVLNPVPGLTYAANVPLRTKASMVGDSISMKVWPASGDEPVGWHLEATDPDPITTPGLTGVQSWVLAGNTNSPALVASFSNYALRADLVTGFADSWVPTFVPTSDGDVASIVRVTVSGILRRLGQGNIARSALTRYLPDTDPVAWWPLEDGVDATQAASGILGGPLMQVQSGIMDFTAESPPGASGSAHPSVSAVNALVGTISGASSSGWHASIWVRADIADDTSSAHCVPWEIRTSTGKILRLVFQSGFAEGLGVGLWDSETQEDETFLLSIPESGITGGWVHVTFSAEQVGGQVNTYLNVNEVEVASAVWAATTIGAPIRVNAIGAFTASGTVPVSDNIRDIYLSHITIHDGVALVPQQWAGEGFPGELASERVERIGAERDIAIYVHPGESEALGPQPTGGDLDVLRDVEAVDGILYERGWGLGYRPNSTRYNQPYGLTVDLSTYQHSAEIRPDQVVAPVYDDQGTRNDVTVSRRDGSSARVIDSDHADRHGVYDDSVELGVATDDVLIHHAAWRVHLGTWEEMRYPGIPVDLAGNPDLIDAWLNLRVGDRARQTNVPPPHPPDDVDQLASGMSQTLTRRGLWSGNIVGTPARPWDIATADGDQRVAADGSTLVAGISDSATSLLLGSTIENGPWVVGDTSTQPDDFPLSVRVGGEVVTVVEIEPSVVETFGGSAASGPWTPANTGQTWSHPAGSASDYPESGGTGRMLMSVVGTLYGAVLDVGTPHAQYTVDLTVNVSSAPGAAVTLWVCAGWVDTNNYNFCRLTLSTGGIMSLGLLRRNAGSLTTVTPSVTGTAHTSGNIWRVTWKADADQFVASMQNITTGAPPVWISGPATDGATGTGIAILARRESGGTGGTITATVDNLTVTAPQLVTVSARGVNGATRAWPAGTPIDVAEPAIAAL